VNPSARVARRPSLQNLWVFDLAPRVESIQQEVIDGLSRPQKELPPKLFYDRRGAQLFNAICATAAYYPTRTENSILRESADEIARAVGAGSAIIEFGAGEMEKIRILLPSLRPSIYAAIDISRDQLLRASEALALEYRRMAVMAVIGDYQSELETELELPPHARRVVFFPGSTIGNFEPLQARDFLQRVRALVGHTGGVLIGVDLQKPVDILNLAYNDPEGHTAAFNLNLLTRLNRELGADFDLSAFVHRAFYNVEQNRIEMHLRSLRRQTVHLGTHVFEFDEGETIHTENSYKYTAQSFVQMAREVGFAQSRMWSDADRLFGVFFLHN
jgi:dimethylhistidine N-methyltransferase